VRAKIKKVLTVEEAMDPWDAVIEPKLLKLICNDPEMRTPAGCKRLGDELAKWARQLRKRQAILEDETCAARVIIPFPLFPF
jgi:hypothetical protein